MTKKYILILGAFLILAVQPLSNVLANFYSYEKTIEAVVLETEQGQLTVSTSAPVLEQPTTSNLKPVSSSQVSVDSLKEQNNSKSVVPTSQTMNAQPAATTLEPQESMDSRNAQNTVGYYPGYGQMGSGNQTDYEWYRCNQVNPQMGRHNWR